MKLAKRNSGLIIRTAITSGYCEKKFKACQKQVMEAFANESDQFRLCKMHKCLIKNNCEGYPAELYADVCKK